MFDKLFSFDSTLGQELFPNTSNFKKEEKRNQRQENIGKKETSNRDGIVRQ